MHFKLIELTIAAIAVAACPVFAQAVHSIRPGQDPQAVIDRAAVGDKILFLPGTHQRGLGKYRAMLYVDKPIDIELQEGAVLKLKDHTTVLEDTPEITTDHGAPKTFDDFSAGGKYDLGLGPVIFTITIDSQGKDGAPDTFKWGSGALFNVKQERVPITGGFQTLSNGVQIHFDHTSGHSVGSLWFVSYDGPAAYGIRIGYGQQKDYIENVRVYGKGAIDLNSQDNVEPSGLVKDINACVLVHGRVRNVTIEGITMKNTMRSVMLYGEHTGKFLQGGRVGPGESFDAENITIQYTRLINPHGSGYLLGHPSHRGRLSKVRCNFNYMETETTSIEPNFQLDQYEVIGNVIKSAGRAIHCWRKSTNGLIKDNVRIDDTTGKEVVMVNAPGAWENPENIILRDNRNHLSDRVGFWANVSGGMENRATGRFSTVDGGRGNLAAADYSSARGWGSKAERPGEDAFAGGYFVQPGDAQASQLVVRAVTKDGKSALMRLASDAPLTIARNATASYRVLVVARSEDGVINAGFEASGVAHLTATGGLRLNGARVAPLYQSDPSLRFAVFADPGTPALNLQVTGVSEMTIRWVARVELAEVKF